jgi:uncharacterized membrane protein
MKESKKFFDNNRLNKGYSRVINFYQSDANLIRKKYRHVLPPIEMIEQYEELYPGTLQRLLEMAQLEQNHRHSRELLEIEEQGRATKLGRMFGLGLVAIISLSAIILVTLGSTLIGVLFALCGFSCITIVSYLSSKANVKKEQNKVRYNNRLNNPSWRRTT